MSFSWVNRVERWSEPRGRSAIIVHEDVGDHTAGVLLLEQGDNVVKQIGTFWKVLSESLYCFTILVTKLIFIFHVLSESLQFRVKRTIARRVNYFSESFSVQLGPPPLCTVQNGLYMIVRMCWLPVNSYPPFDRTNGARTSTEPASHGY